MKRKMQFNKKGFTLIEILIVVAIIGILASIVLVGLGPAQTQGRDARRLSDLKQTQVGLELYFHKCGFYPGPIQNDPSGSCTSPFGITVPTEIPWSDMSTALVQSLIGVTAIPNDPVRTKNYVYAVNGNGTSYVLGATLEGPNTVLDSDVDGTVNTIDCTDPLYCVQL